MMPSNHLILCHPLLLLPSIFPSIRIFSNESGLCNRWPKYWSFSFSFSLNPSNEYLGLISLKIDWFALLAVQGTLRSLLQHDSSKASILRHSAFFIVYLYIHTSIHDYGKNTSSGAILSQSPPDPFCKVRRLKTVSKNTHQSVQFSSVAQSCLTLCNPMNCSMPGLPVHHQLLEFTQTHVHWVGDAIQPSHSLSSPSPPAPNPSHRLCHLS